MLILTRLPMVAIHITRMDDQEKQIEHLNLVFLGMLRGDRVRLGLNCPDNYRILRDELVEKDEQHFLNLKRG